MHTRRNWLRLSALSLLGAGSTSIYAATPAQRRLLLFGGKHSVYRGLNAYWKFTADGNDSVNGLNFTLVNAPTFGANGMTTIIASSQYAEQANQTDLNPTGGFTLCGWVNFSSVAAFPMIVCKYNSVAGTGSYFLSLNTARVSGALYNQAGTSGIPALHGTTLSAGTRYFLEMTWDLSTVSVNVNRGTPVTAALTGTGVNQYNTPLRIAAYPSQTAPATYSSFTIKDLGLWSRALTSTELDYLYNSGNGRPLY